MDALEAWLLGLDASSAVAATSTQAASANVFQLLSLWGWSDEVKAASAPIVAMFCAFQLRMHAWGSSGLPMFVVHIGV